MALCPVFFLSFSSAPSLFFPPPVPERLFPIRARGCCRQPEAASCGGHRRRDTVAGGWRKPLAYGSYREISATLRQQPLTRRHSTEQHCHQSEETARPRPSERQSLHLPAQSSSQEAHWREIAANDRQRSLAKGSTARDRVHEVAAPSRRKSAQRSSRSPCASGESTGAPAPAPPSGSNPSSSASTHTDEAADQACGWQAAG